MCTLNQRALNAMVRMSVFVLLLSACHVPPLYGQQAESVKDKQSRESCLARGD